MCLYYCSYLTGFVVQRMHSRKNRQKKTSSPLKKALCGDMESK